MKRFKQFILIWFLAAFSVQVFAQALPVSRMQNAISGVIQQKLFGRGLVQFDPRIGITLQGAGSSIGGAVAGAAVVTAAGVTAPAWVTVGATVALGALFTVGINLAIDGVKWLLNGDGTVTVGTPGAGNNLAAGTSYRNEQQCGNNTYRSITDAVLCGSALAYNVEQIQSGGMGTGGTVFAKVILGGVPGWSTVEYWKSYPGGTTMLMSSSGYISLYQSSPTKPLLTADPVPGPAPTTPSAAAAAVSDADKAKPLNPAVIAQIADAAFKKAAQELGYAGAPYDVNDPITEEDVKRWIIANPTFAPTVGDALAPQPAPAGGTATSPFTLPVGAPSATADPAVKPPVTNPGTGSQVNLGPDPGIGSPTLEATPTAQSILDPLLNSIPGVRSFVVPAHESTCPAAAFRVWDHDFNIDGQCQLAEQMRTPISVTMLLFFALAALLILLSA